MAKELSDYVIDELGRICYYSSHTKNNYVVWAVCEHGFQHGVGNYLKKEIYGLDYKMLFEPTFQEIEEYYKNWDKLFGNDD